MRVGSLVYNVSNGLGILAKSFWDNGIITDAMVIRHGRHPENDWYPGQPRCGDLRGQLRELQEFCAKMDVMFFFETPFRWELVNFCRDRGVKTVLMTMYECCFLKLPAEPDLIINPSLLDQQYYPRGVFIPVPVDVPWRLRTKAEVFIHNSGHGGLKGRNGTREVIEAWKLLKSDAKLILRAQDGFSILSEIKSGIRNVDIRGNTEYGRLFEKGDVFLFPEKFNGLSLPLQEAYASGMLVMCGDRYPMNTWLPGEPLIPVHSYRKNSIGPPYNTFDEALFDPKTIAATVDGWYGRDITEYSLSGKKWAEENSWEKLKPSYMEVLNDLARR